VNGVAACRQRPTQCIGQGVGTAAVVAIPLAAQLSFLGRLQNGALADVLHQIAARIPAASAESSRVHFLLG